MCTRFFPAFGSGTRDEDQRQRAGVGVVIAVRPYHHLAGLLGANLPAQGRGPEPRQARRVGGVNDKVHQTGRHTANLPSAARPAATAPRCHGR